MITRDECILQGISSLLKMNPVTKKQGIFKRFLDARWAWDLIQGPIYARNLKQHTSCVNSLYVKFNFHIMHKSWMQVK